MISEHSTSDHIAYVQKSITKVHRHGSAQHSFEPSNVGAAGLQAWGEPLKWSYTPSPSYGPVEPYGPNSWSMVEGAAACAEVGSQSPIDLRFGSAIKLAHEVPADLVLVTDGDCPLPAFLTNERTVQVEYIWDDNCKTALKATYLGVNYSLEQFHYRAPSEHTIDGGYFPMEVDHVHKDANGNALVIAVMVAVGSGADDIWNKKSDFLSSVLSNAPKPGDDQANNRFEIAKASEYWNPYTDFIPDMSEGYYTYLGSLTIPPCTAGVFWIIAPKPVKIPADTVKMYRELINSNSISQVAAFGTIMGGYDQQVPNWNPESGMIGWDASLGCNTRPIQPFQGPSNPTRLLFKCEK